MPERPAAKPIKWTPSLRHKGCAALCAVSLRGRGSTRTLTGDQQTKSAQALREVFEESAAEDSASVSTEASTVDSFTRAKYQAKWGPTMIKDWRKVIEEGSAKASKKSKDPLKQQQGTQPTEVPSDNSDVIVRMDRPKEEGTSGHLTWQGSWDPVLQEFRWDIVQFKVESPRSPRTDEMRRAKSIDTSRSSRAAEAPNESSRAKSVDTSEVHCSEVNKTLSSSKKRRGRKSRNSNQLDGSASNEDLLWMSSRRRRSSNSWRSWQAVERAEHIDSEATPSQPARDGGKVPAVEGLGHVQLAPGSPACQLQFPAAKTPRSPTRRPQCFHIGDGEDSPPGDEPAESQSVDPSTGSSTLDEGSFGAWLCKQRPLLRFEHMSCGKAWDFPLTKSEKREMLILHMAQGEHDARKVAESARPLRMEDLPTSTTEKARLLSKFHRLSRRLSGKVWIQQAASITRRRPKRDSLGKSGTKSHW